MLQFFKSAAISGLKHVLCCILTLQRFRGRVPLYAFTYLMLTTLFCSFCFQKTANANSVLHPTLSPKDGSADDLSGVHSKGWKFGEPLSCKALEVSTSDLQASLVTQALDACKRDNAVRAQKGQVTCPGDSCLDYVKKGQAYDLPVVQLNLQYSSLTDSISVSISLAQILGPKGERSIKHCISRADLEFSVSRQIQSPWTFDEFLKMCGQQP